MVKLFTKIDLMKVAGFTFIRNAVKNDYPVVEAITSVLPVCDEFIVAVGNSDGDNLNDANNLKASNKKELRRKVLQKIEDIYQIAR